MPEQRVLVGDALTRLRELPEASVSVCVTSPPYMGLRSYSTNPQVWGGDGSCADGDHDWQHRRYYVEGGGKTSSAEAFHEAGPENAARLKATRWKEDDTCGRCGAWRGELGTERTVEEFVSHLVDVFREVKRCLRDDGSMFVVCGDSYSSGSRTTYDHDDKLPARASNIRPSAIGIPGKNLLLVPFALAFALRADGWWIRSILPWLKWQSCMPESARDRPTSAVEYIIMCTKKKNYHWDGPAITRANSSPEQLAHNRRYAKPHAAYDDRAGTTGQPGNVNNVGIHSRAVHEGRRYRNADAFIDSLDAAILSARAHLAHLEAVRAAGGLLSDEEGDPLALLVNPQPFTARSLGFKDGTDHYAAYPSALITPLIKAACPERVCPIPGCGAPWERVVKTNNPSKWINEPGSHRGFPAQSEGHNVQSSVTMKRNGTGVFSSATTLGFRPTCSCPDNTAETAIPGTTLDCFAGTGTTAITAARLGRSSISIELSPAYAQIIEQNLAQRGSPLFSETVAEPAPSPNGRVQPSLFDETPHV